MTAKTNTASRLSSRATRNRTAATMPARLNASAALLRTSVATIATTTGRRISVCTIVWLYPFFCRVNMYVHDTGTHITIAAPDAITPINTTASGGNASTTGSGVMNPVGGELLKPNSSCAAEYSRYLNNDGTYSDSTVPIIATNT